MQWLSPIDFTAQQSDIISRRQDGTAQWFLESLKFKSWLQGPDKTLFCPGIPGAGKTMIAAVAIDHLCQMAHSTGVGVAYLFCSYKAQFDQSALNLFAAILKQLVRGWADPTDLVQPKFQSDPQLDVRADDEDVRCFVIGQMPRLPKCIRKDENLKNDVQNKIVEAVDGIDIDLVIVNAKDSRGRTALQQAARGGHEAVVQLLLATGQVNIDSKNDVGETALQQAAEGGHEAVVQLLLATGQVDVNSKDKYGWTALQWAAQGGHKAVVKLLLATGRVDVDLSMTLLSEYSREL
ncbi:MAG: hypothetical protein Q9162_007855 [Coniocarpon cinnabarinum]